MEWSFWWLLFWPFASISQYEFDDFSKYSDRGTLGCQEYHSTRWSSPCDASVHRLKFYPSPLARLSDSLQ